MDKYKETCKQITFASPIQIRTFLSTVIDKIKLDLDEGINQYYIILIMLSGSVNDINETKAQLVKTAELPISVFFVAVGNCDNYKEMEQLIKDESPIYNSQGDKIKRDNIQLVYYNGKNIEEEIFKEIPRQVEEFFEMEKSMKFSLLSN